MAKRERSHAIVLFIDLDKFKKVNDVYGHQEGDWVLKTVSARMAECLRGVDTLARLGGDEFAVVLAPPTNELEAVMIGERLIQQCERPLVSSKNTYHIGASVGMAIYPEDGGDIDTLLRNADIAMYQVKRQGRGFVTRYQHDQSTQIEHRNRMEILLRAALEQQKVCLLYQPQVYALDGRLAGFEALVRILDEQGNFVSPADFIPVAEETGLIKQLTQQIIQLAIAQQRSWCQMPNVELVKVSINLSVYQIRDRGFGQHLLDQLADSGLMPACIGVEVTESEAIEHYDEAVRLLSRLRAAGLTVAIDDFGAGYSSLTHLKNLPVDVLKVDKAFIDDVPGDTNGENLVQSVLALAKSLQLTVIAEGVEREEQLNWLRGQRCEIIQGYIYAPPVSAEQATEWLKSRYATR
jgi:diguanylate cyclase (GGDEF)-like protein